ncbi:helix-turn-helix transcriptional regulator [Pseudomonas flexibilis]|uniref:helix-turn-helix transcriptional regulator n=1 Tax=Pseudomonas flexibilis TaxID=706570 RepID=UPI0022782E52|nr:AlpA family phage regulatory protein [Pseudomonas flexibilis]
MEKRGEFPQHFMLTPRCAGWFEAEVDAWLDQRMAKPRSCRRAPMWALSSCSPTARRARLALKRPAAPRLTPAWERRKMVFPRLPK